MEILKNQQSHPFQYKFQANLGIFDLFGMTP